MEKREIRKRRWEVNYELINFKNFNDIPTKIHNKTFKKLSDNFKECKISNDYINTVSEVLKIQLSEVNLIKIRDGTHEIAEKDLRLIKQIFQRVYPKILKYLEQRSFSYYHQYRITKSSRLICSIDKKNKIIYPIIFDLHHLLISVSNPKDLKKQKQAKLAKNFEWNFVSYYDEIINKIENKVN